MPLCQPLQPRAGVAAVAAVAAEEAASDDISIPAAKLILTTDIVCSAAACAHIGTHDVASHADTTCPDRRATENLTS